MLTGEVRGAKHPYFIAGIGDGTGAMQITGPNKSWWRSSMDY